ncbi:MAG: KH domain-containing protein [Clostridia bacterium]|nr:KH domain-containing protein [Clostridia bacterium]
MDKIQELIKYVVEQFAEKKSEVEYAVDDREPEIYYPVYLAEIDMGKVIGKQGKIAKALRTLVSASAPRSAKRCTVEIKEKV